MNWHQFIGITLLLYGLINPVGAVPIYLHLVRNMDAAKAQRILFSASLAVACLLVFAALFGAQILKFFSVGLDDFRIAGGILALVIAFEMFQAHYGGFLQTIQVRAEAESELHGVAITPLAFPLLVGPAEMSVMITLSNDTLDALGKVWLVSAALFTTAFTMITLKMARAVSGLLGTTGINVVTRLMALIVASVGINFILVGLKNQLPGLAL